MSFGFGSNNNNASGGFGGFGSNANTTSSGSIFGSNTATAGSGGGFGGFGGANKPTFGASTPAAGSLFGGGASAGGGFGSNTTPAQTSSFGGFGSNNNNASGGGLFGSQNKPSGFGSTTGGTSGGLFGGGGGGTSTGGQFGGTSSGFGAGSGTGFGGGFGSTTNPASQSSTSGGGFGGGFGSTNTTAGGFGAGAGAGAPAGGNNNQGTSATPFQPFQEKDTATNTNSHYQSISFMTPYSGKSFEELRCEDYAQGRRYGNTNGQSGAFGQSSGFGSNTGGFGSTANTGGGLFGSTNNSTNAPAAATTTPAAGFGGFGSTSTQPGKPAFGGFGASTTNTGAGGLFGQSSSGTASGGFGSTAGSGGGLFGNQNNSSGAFGQNNSGGGLFGQNNNNNQPQQPSTGFGSTNTTGGGLFGSNNQQQNKPAFGGFGASATNTGGGLFGSNTQQQQQQPTSGGFGASTNTGGGLFGNNNQQTQNKPAFGGFGQSNTGGGFGQTNTNTGGSLFGNNNQSQQNSNPFGGGASNTGGSLFGNTQQNAGGGGMFGGANKPAASGSLFGSTTTSNTGGGGLFGNQNQNANTGGSLFGNPASNAGGSLFGNSTAAKPAGGSLFGNTNQNSNAGGSLFGGNIQQGNAGGSLFGSTNNNQSQQNPGSSLFGSLNSNQGQQQNALSTSLIAAPYGNEQLFSSLAAPSPPVGPLATPLNGAKPPARKTNSLLASSRLGSPAYNTPRAGGSFGRSGYGFSYSTYGTPSSVSSFSGSLTPGAQSLLKPTGSLGSGLSQRLGLTKSASMNSLRGDSDSGRPSLLNSTPNAGSIRRLKIDRSLRMDLFSPVSATSPATNGDADNIALGPGPSGLKKSVSFDRNIRQDGPPGNGVSSHGQESNAAPDTSNALVRTDSPTEDAPRTNGTLATVDEDATPQPKKTASPPAQGTPAAGEYWSEPTIRNLKAMSRSQLQHQKLFTVGRDNVGKIEFHNPDLSSIDFDNLFGKIIILDKAHATVYPDNTTKPKQGFGLNVPSTIWLQGVWPKKNKNAEALKGENIPKPVLEKHLRLLKKVGGTKFLNYDPKRGEWNFGVDHYTTYGFEDDDEDGTMHDVEEVASSPLNGTPERPGDVVMDNDLTSQSFETRTSQEGPEEDTFQFKIERSRLGQSDRSSIHSTAVPGGFAAEHGNTTYDYDDYSADESMDEIPAISHHGLTADALVEGIEDPFIESAVAGGAVREPSPDAMNRYRSSLMQEDELIPADEEDAHDVPGSFRKEIAMPKSILKHSVIAPLSFDEAWEEKLQRTMSPKKQARNRHELRDLQRSVLRPEDAQRHAESPFKRNLFAQSAISQSQFGQSYLATKSATKSELGQNINDDGDFKKSQAFKTSMDIMNSLWAQEKSTGRKAAADKFTFPNKRARVSTSKDATAEEAAFLSTVPPSFAADGTLVYEAKYPATNLRGFTIPLQPVVGEGKDVRFAKFEPAIDIHSPNLAVQKDASDVTEEKGMPRACPPTNLSFATLSNAVAGGSGLAIVEYRIWRLCSVLFDDLAVVGEKFTAGMSSEQMAQYEPWIRRDALKDLWAELTSPSVEARATAESIPDVKALLLLTTNDIEGACEALTAGRHFKLATMIAQIPHAARGQMANQISAWLERNDWSDMSHATRALYCVLAGEFGRVSGKENTAQENRVFPFSISEEFRLDWEQAFGLRLFCDDVQSIEDAVKSYMEDVTSGKEVVPPTSVVSGVPGSKHQDTLIQLLRLACNGSGSGNVAELLDPITVSGSANNSRLAWQMATLLKSTSTIDVPDQIVDKLTLDYASELDTAGSYITASWVLLHLSEASDRQAAIQSLLDRNSAKIPEPVDASDDIGSSTMPTDPTDFDVLVHQNGIPEGLIWIAKALAAASVFQDPYLQATYLLNAATRGQPQAIEEAHSLLCSTVGPQAIIEEEYEPLAALLERFDQASTDAHLDAWEAGGQVYADFVTLVQMHARELHSRNSALLLQRLQRGLIQMERARGKVGKQQNQQQHVSLIERVALSEMVRVVDEILKEVEGEGAASTAKLGQHVEEFSGRGAALWRGYQQALLGIA
ncbi:hypothetical protein K431DRAFT_307713 [Polychaeton citri CBS 116435]|uniref:Peptidase S59 domain-containing protein n=1 Tax=Polychaeton citri CBS 116435 TaxID=1314669 RepID=A0A9P4Q114_9PEZI|nr:hypothetical protein K431DRAFT_307713 [Polychaeton citri CBS 116435]